MKPINFRKIEASTFFDKHGTKRQIKILGSNEDWIWIFPYSVGYEPNCFLFQIDWNTNTFDVLTAVRGEGTRGKIFPAHTGLKLRVENYNTLDTFIKFISDWVNDNLSYLHINVR